MSTWTPSDDELASAVAAALAPYPWRRFTPDLLARFVPAARDRLELAGGLAGVQGAAVGTWEKLEPSDRTDSRVPRVVEVLPDLRWSELTLLATCRNLVGVLNPERR